MELLLPLPTKHFGWHPSSALINPPTFKSSGSWLLSRHIQKSKLEPTLNSTR
jgi:hypothetical protein